MKAYAPLAMLRGELRMQARDPGSAEDAARLRALERATLDIDQRTRRRFEARVAQTAYYQGDSHEPTVLYIDDFASITSVSVGRLSDGTYQYSLVDGTDYWAIRIQDDSAKPIVRLELIGTSAQVASWPTGQRGVKVVGTAGWSYETEAIVADDGTAVTGTLTSASDISLALSVSSHGVTPGDTLVLASEQVYVQAVIDALTVRVERGVNGTTAAAQSAVAVSRRRYPRDIEAACVMRAADLYRGGQTAWADVIAADDVSGFLSRTSYAQFVGLLAPYVRHSVVIG